MSKDQIEWDPAAEERVNRAPVFVRPMARRKVENAARELGHTRITVELLEKIKQQEMGAK